jgi:hypothetical protein
MGKKNNKGKKNKSPVRMPVSATTINKLTPATSEAPSPVASPARSPPAPARAPATPPNEESDLVDAPQVFYLFIFKANFFYTF